MNFTEQRQRLVERLAAEGILRTKRVTKSLRTVPREEFVQENLKRYSYLNIPLAIGHGQFMCAPDICATMNEALELDVGHRVLEIGAGSGYHAALVAEIVAPSSKEKEKWGHVYTVEIVPDLAFSSTKNLERTGYLERISVIIADGFEGYPNCAPYDRIFVSAAAQIVPASLITQLKLGGFLEIPVGSWQQDLFLIEKTEEGKIKTKLAFDRPVAFEPLKWSARAATT